MMLVALLPKMSALGGFNGFFFFFWCFFCFVCVLKTRGRFWHSFSQHRLLSSQMAGLSCVFIYFIMSLLSFLLALGPLISGAVPDSFDSFAHHAFTVPGTAPCCQ